jgi:hemolysin activation/secretion protein
VNGRFLSICWVLAILAVPLTAAAQPLGSSIPGATQKHSQDTLEFYRLENLLERPAREEEVLEAPPAAEENGADKTQVSFLLRKVVTNPSQVLAAEDIRAVTSPYEGRKVSMEDLFHLLEGINQLYAARGIVTAKAFLPPQTVTDGVVEIRLVESRLGDVIVEGNADTSARYIAGSFSLLKGEFLALDSLEAELRRFNRLNDVSVKAELRPGEIPLSTDCVLKVTEPFPYAFLVYADNAGQKDTGRERAGALLTVKSLLGRRDPLTLGGNAAEGVRAGFISYAIPVHRTGARLGAAYNISTIKVVEGIFEPLKITGQSSDLDLNLSTPLRIEENSQLGAHLGFHWKKSTTDFDDVKLFETKVRSAYLDLDYQVATENSAFYGRGRVTQGFHDFGGDRSFFKVDLDLAYRLRLEHNFALLVRGAGQVSDVHLLPSMEQFQIGGMATVRGYSEGLKIGDDGYFVSLEMHTPMPEWKVFGQALNEMVQGVLFVDHGGAFPYKGNDESIDHTDYLTSVGGGMLFQFSQYLGGRVYLGVPLGERENDQDSIRLHFFLQSRFF